jgi:hypothetical protein
MSLKHTSSITKLQNKLTNWLKHEMMAWQKQSTRKSHRACSLLDPNAKPPDAFQNVAYSMKHKQLCEFIRIQETATPTPCCYHSTHYHDQNKAPAPHFSTHRSKTSMKSLRPEETTARQKSGGASECRTWLCEGKDFQRIERAEYTKAMFLRLPSIKSKPSEGITLV